MSLRNHLMGLAKGLVTVDDSLPPPIETEIYNPDSPYELQPRDTVPEPGTELLFTRQGYLGPTDSLGNLSFRETQEKLEKESVELGQDSESMETEREREENHSLNLQSLSDSLPNSPCSSSPSADAENPICIPEPSKRARI